MQAGAGAEGHGGGAVGLGGGANAGGGWNGPPAIRSLIYLGSDEDCDGTQPTLVLASKSIGTTTRRVSKTASTPAASRNSTMISVQ